MDSDRPPAVGAVAPFHPLSAADYLPREPLRMLQSQRLRDLVARLHDDVPVFRGRMHKSGVVPADIRGIDDLPRLPLTTAEELEAEHAPAMLAVPLRRVVAIDAITGPRGQAILLPYSRKDVRLLAHIAARALACCGVAADDLVEIILSRSAPSLRALAAGAEELGAAVVRRHGDVARRACEPTGDLPVSVLCREAEAALPPTGGTVSEGAKAGRSPLRLVVLVGEHPRGGAGETAEGMGGAQVRRVFGLGATVVPVLAAQCTADDGFHFFEEFFIPEVIDPDSTQPLPDGVEGELVVTTLVHEAAPLVRLRTGCRAAVLAGACACGRTVRRVALSRVEPASVRTGAAPLSAQQTEAVLRAVVGQTPPYRWAEGADPAGRLDGVLEIEVTAALFNDRVGAIERLERRIARAVEEAAGARVEVHFVEPRAVGPHRLAPPPGPGAQR